MTKIWLITGSSRGLGRELARTVLAAGDRLVATARKPEDLRDLVDQYGDRVRAVALDVTDPAAARAAVTVATSAFGRLDVVVNNAGYANINSIEDVTERDFRTQFETNFFGVVNVTRAAVPILREQRGGHIIQVSSIGGRGAAPVDVLVLERSALARAFLTRNSDLYEVLLPELETALHERVGSSTLADDVRSVLRRNMRGERPSIEKVADALRMSPRTLQRHLAELETSYQELLDDVRDDTARRLLLDTDLDAGEIAFLLGFDELNSFTRAFHGRQGATPLDVRVSLAARDVVAQPVQHDAPALFVTVAVGLTRKAGVRYA